MAPNTRTIATRPSTSTLDIQRAALQKALTKQPDAVAIIPLRTVSENNQREHWATKAKRVAAHRNSTKIVVGMSLLKFRNVPQYWSGFTVIQLTRHSPRALDGDNLNGALKAVRDGVTDALKFGDDRESTKLAWLYDQRQAKDHEVLVSIWF